MLTLMHVNMTYVYHFHGFLLNIRVWRYQRGISKNRQHNDQQKRYKRTNNDLRHIYIKLKIK